MNDPTPPNGNRKFVLRVVVIALAAVVASDLFIIVGRGITCALKGGCPAEEWSNGAEMLAGLLATLIALVFALIEGRKP